MWTRRGSWCIFRNKVAFWFLQDEYKIPVWTLNIWFTGMERKENSWSIARVFSCWEKGCPCTPRTSAIFNTAWLFHLFSHEFCSYGNTLFCDFKALPFWPWLKVRMPFIEKVGLLYMIFSDIGHATDNFKNWSRGKIIVIFLKHNTNAFEKWFLVLLWASKPRTAKNSNKLHIFEKCVFRVH